VRGVASAAEGVAKAGESRPDLVLMDLRLPDADGDTVLQSLQRLPPDLPVVVMSEDATLKTVRDLRRRGACGFLAKPCAAILLQALVGYLL
jgi:DNA-binding NtrC family response regulator